MSPSEYYDQASYILTRIVHDIYWMILFLSAIKTATGMSRLVDVMTANVIA